MFKVGRKNIHACTNCYRTFFLTKTFFFILKYRLCQNFRILLYKSVTEKGILGEKLKCPLNPDQNKCPKQVKSPILLHTCAPLSELPSNISAMDPDYFGG